MDQTDQEYEAARVEAMKAQGAHFVPEGTGKKRYIVTCESSDDWKYVHKILMEDGTLEDNIPSDKCDCVNEYKTCDRIGTYLLDDAEVADLKNHPKVWNVNLDCEYYEGTFKGVNERPAVLSYRYPANVKCGRLMGTAFFPSMGGGVTDSTYLSRTGSSIYRHTQKDDPWNGQSELNVLQNRIQHHGDGTDVDVIVCDESGWHGHIEFIKTGSGEPTNYVGENVLKSGFASSSTTGVCDVLDFVLDTPYYLDPDFFEADVANRLTTRWDGTRVPVESVARAWWDNESTTYRSAKYVSSDLPGGTATIGSDQDFGTIFISSSYTRAAKNGSNTTQHTSGGYHATPCMAQAYGKTHGWAYNANKWHMNIIWSTGAINISNMFKMLKVFHQNKPNRSSDNTKNPTLTSHSWGSNRNLSNNYYFYRTPGDGTGGVAYTSSTKPNFLSWLYYGTRHSAFKDPSYSEMVLGADVISAGVLFFAASGNDNMKMVHSGHPDYNNYDGSNGSTTTLVNALSPDAYGSTAMTNRTGFPACIGRFWNGSEYIQPAFNIGALDDQKVTTVQERKASYSNTGNAIDLWTHGKGSLAGTDDNTTTRYDRYDNYYRIDSNYNVVSSGGTQSDDAQDRSFGGTSSACPVACGLVATIVQHNRTWTYEDVKNWLVTSVDNQSSARFRTGTEGVTATDSNYAEYYNLHGNNGKILYQALPAYTITPSASVVDEGDSITTTITTEHILNGVNLYWNITGTNIDVNDFSSGSLSGQGTVNNNALPSFSHTLANDVTTEGVEVFNINLFTDVAMTTQVATTAITVNDTSVPVVPTYTISPSPLTVNEGSTVTTTVTTTNIADNTTLWWSLSGMNQVDFTSGALTGFGIITSNTFSFTHTLAADQITEGTEYINYELWTDSGRTARVGIATVTVLDTSQAEPVFVPVTLSGSGVTLSGVTVNIK
tara:strand:- start:1313 stop:4138 length:2826 start_codon:yes stop_codon:yes gene_type:complete